MMILGKALQVSAAQPRGPAGRMEVITAHNAPCPPTKDRDGWQMPPLRLVLSMLVDVQSIERFSHHTFP